MIKYLPAVASLVLLVATGMSLAAEPSKGESPRAAATKAAPARTVAPKVPADIAIPASVGEVRFPHRMHIEGLSMKCGDCHHQINAKKLSTPHPDYFASSWINCKTCHDESGKAAQKPYVCSECHRTRPKNIADETLSAKVVVHKQCWKCHTAGTGKEASEGCEKCHSGKKKS